MKNDKEAVLIATKIKYVKKAKMWVKADFYLSSDGKRSQKLQWFSEKPTI